MSSMTHYAAAVPAADILNFGDLSNQAKSLIVLGVLIAVAVAVILAFKGKIGKVAGIVACVILALMLLGLSDLGNATSFGTKVFAFVFNR